MDEADAPARRSYAVRLVHGGPRGAAFDFLRALRISLILFFATTAVVSVLTGFGGLVVLELFALVLVVGGGGALLRLLDQQGKQAGHVEVVSRRLRFVSDNGRGHHSLALDRVRSARIVPEAERSLLCQLVVRSTFGRRTVLGFGDIEDARALLHEMRMSPREESSTFYFFFGLYVTVGADGVLLRWPLLRRQRFVPYAKILSVTSLFGRIELRLTGGDIYEIMTTTSKRSREQQQHQALLERIAHACVSYRAEHAEEPTALLDRSGRSALGWVKDLSLLGQTGGGYRVASLPVDTLWNVALDPAAEEEARIGAALALRSGLDPEGREKLRIAAEASASPKVRVALDAAAGDLTDEQLGEAIEAAAPARRYV